MTVDTDRLVDTMVSGFVDDPLYVWLYPDPRRRPSQLRPTFELTLQEGIEHGHVRWTDDHDAVAIWTPPGVPLLSDDAMDTWLAVLRTEVGDRFDAAAEGMAACAEHEPAEPHWTLHSIVVARDRQGQGLGTSLLQQTLAEVDSAGLPAHLDSSNERNVSAYRRVGFEVVGEVPLRDGPVMRPMTRPGTAGGSRRPDQSARPPGSQTELS